MYFPVSFCWTTALDPTFGSFTLLKPVSHYCRLWFEQIANDNFSYKQLVANNNFFTSEDKQDENEMNSTFALPVVSNNCGHIEC